MAEPVYYCHCCGTYFYIAANRFRVAWWVFTRNHRIRYCVQCRRA